MRKQERRLVVFDVMDTLIYDPWREAIEAATGLSYLEVNRRRDPLAWERVELGKLSEAEYWEYLRECGIVADVNEYHRVRRAGYAWLPGMRELVREVCGTSHRVVLASNYSMWFDEMQAEYLADINVPVYVSYRLGARKPSSVYFERILSDHDSDYASMVLVDDSPTNIEGLIGLGGAGVTHIDNHTTRTQLRELGVI